jgi:hypothetical protein
MKKWSEGAEGASLIYTVLSAKAVFPKMWDRALYARDLTPNELGGMEKKQKAWQKKRLK